MVAPVVLSHIERQRWLSRMASVARQKNKAETGGLAMPLEPSHLSNHVFLGTTLNASDKSQMNTFHISHVLNCALGESSLTKKAIGKSVLYHHLGGSSCDTAAAASQNENKLNGDIEMATVAPGDDRQSNPPSGAYRPETNCDGEDRWLAEVFDEAYGFLEDARSSGGRVLVCCLSGLNRSPLIAAAYLMYSEHMALLAALQRLRRVRGMVLQVKGHLEQLFDFACQQKALDASPETFIVSDAESDDVDEFGFESLGRFDDFMLEDDAVDTSDSSSAGDPADG